MKRFSFLLEQQQRIRKSKHMKRLKKRQKLKGSSSTESGETKNVRLRSWKKVCADPNLQKGHSRIPLTSAQEAPSEPMVLLG